MRPNSFLKAVLLPSIFGLLVGACNFFGSQEFVLSKLTEWLHDDPTGLFLFGGYFTILGIVGVAGIFTTIEKLKVGAYVRKLSVVKWYSKAGGLVSGLLISAIPKGPPIDLALLLFFAVMLFAVTWVVWCLEKMVFAELPDNNKKNLTTGVASTGSLLIGVYALYLAWITSHGGHL